MIRVWICFKRYCFVIRRYKLMIKLVIFGILSVKNVSFKVCGFMFNKDGIGNKWGFIKVMYNRDIVLVSRITWMR